MVMEKYEMREKNNISMLLCSLPKLLPRNFAFARKKKEKEKENKGVFHVNAEALK